MMEIQKHKIGEDMGYDARILVELTAHSRQWETSEGITRPARKDIYVLADVRFSYDRFSDWRKFREDVFAAEDALIRAYRHYPEDADLSVLVEFVKDDLGEY